MCRTTPHATTDVTLFRYEHVWIPSCRDTTAVSETFSWQWLCQEKFRYWKCCIGTKLTEMVPWYCCRGVRTSLLLSGGARPSMESPLRSAIELQDSGQLGSLSGSDLQQILRNHHRNLFIHPVHHYDNSPAGFQMTG